MWRYISIIFMGVILSFVGLLASGITGIQGYVKDKTTSEPLVGVIIQIDSTVQISSDDRGFFQYLGLPAGSHQLHLELLGYHPLQVAAVYVYPGEIKQLTLEMVSGNTDSSMMLLFEDQISLIDGKTVFRSAELDESPRRGIISHLELANSMIYQDEQFHLMGSRQEEIGYFVNGQWATDAVNGGPVLPVIHDALESIQVQPGAVDPYLGPATAGVVQTVLKTGGDRFQATVDFHSDRVANEGKQFLGTYSYRWQNVTLTLGGPLFANNWRYFLAFENTNRGDRLVRFGKGFTIDNLVDQNMSNPENYDNGVFVGGDTVSLHFPDGFTPHNYLNRQRLNATLTYLGKKMNFQTHLLFQKQKMGADQDPWFNVLNDRIPYDQNTTMVWGGTFIHNLLSNLSYQLQFNYFRDFTERGDSYLGTDWQSWYDSVAVAQATNGEVQYRNRALPDFDYLLAGFLFNRRGDVSSRYFKQYQQYLGGALAINWVPAAKHNIQIGADFRRYTLRYFEINPRVMLYALPYDSVYSWYHGLPISYQSIYSVPVNIWMDNGSVFSYGYDIYGNPLNSVKMYDQGIYALGAPHPVFASAYVRDFWRLDENFWLDVGLRYDYLNSDQYQLKGQGVPPLADFRIVDYAALQKAKPFHEFSPRLKAIFRRKNGDRFYIAYGRFVQMPRLSESLFMPMQSYQFQQNTIWHLSLEPIKTNLLMMGYHHSFEQGGTLGVNVFYRNTTGLTRVGKMQPPEWNAFYIYRFFNDAESISKGIQLAFETPRLKGFKGRLLYTYSINTGTASFADAYFQQVIFNRTVPEEYYPLDYHQAHRGMLWLHYTTGTSQRWKFLNNIGISGIFRFNSGHPYTRMSYPDGLSPYMAGVTFASLQYPVQFLEEVNASRTPWNTQFDLRVDKTFYYSPHLAITIYARILNVLNARNVVNVFPSTGSDQDDGVINRSTYQQWLNEYGPDFAKLYRAIKIDNGGSYFSMVGKDLWGHPRQILIGLKIQY